MCPRDSGSSGSPLTDGDPVAVEGEHQPADRLAQVAHAPPLDRRHLGILADASVTVRRVALRTTSHPVVVCACMDTTQLLKGVLDLAVLAVVDDEDGYGYDVVRRLRAGGLEERRRRVGLRHAAPALRGRRPDVVRRPERRGPAPQVLRHHRHRPGPAQAAARGLGGASPAPSARCSTPTDHSRGSPMNDTVQARRPAVAAFVAQVRARLGRPDRGGARGARRRPGGRPRRAAGRGRDRARRPGRLRRRAARRGRAGGPPRAWAGGAPAGPRRPVADHVSELLDARAGGWSAGWPGTRGSPRPGRSPRHLRPAWWVLRAWVAVQLLDLMAGPVETAHACCPRWAASCSASCCCSPPSSSASLLGLGRLWPGSRVARRRRPRGCCCSGSTASRSWC